FTAYRRDIEISLRAFLAHHVGMDFIVLTKGIPLRLRDTRQDRGVAWFSLDSHLAALDYDKTPGAIRVDIHDPQYDKWWLSHLHARFHAQAWANRFWNSTEPFSHDKFGGYLVTRLDGYTEADAKALTTRSLLAEQAVRAGRMPEGEILLNVAPNYGFADKAQEPY